MIKVPWRGEKRLGTQAYLYAALWPCVSGRVAIWYPFCGRAVTTLIEHLERRSRG
jgi:hypothetical protein